MRKKILSYIIQVIFTAAFFILTLWLFNVIFDKDSSFGWELIIQGLIFSVIYVALIGFFSKKKPS